VIRLGWTHAAVIGMLQPDIAHPGRTVRPSETAIVTLYRHPCTCPDSHIEVWVEPVTVDEQERLFY
jgi:hypothetical protein